MLSFVETPLFTRLVSDFLSDEEYAALQNAFLANPQIGALIPGSGGLRKVRWAPSGRGKSGGVRIIYYLRTRAGLIWMLTIYAKGQTESIPAHVLRRIAKEIEDAEG